MNELKRALDTIMTPGFGSVPARPDEPSSGPWSRELVKAIAMDIGKAVVHHIETMYPDAAAAVAKSSFKLSVRNTVYNEIMAAIEVNDAGQITARLKERKQHRRKINAIRAGRDPRFRNHNP